MSVAEKLVDYEVLKREPDVILAELRPFVFADGGAKAIRELMLELAVTGKLTERLHDDDSAAAHLDEIAAERQTLAESLGVRLKTSKQSDVRAPHADWPCEWATTSVGNLGVFLGGGTPSKQNPAYWEGDIPWVSPKDMKRPYINDAIDHVSADGVENSSAKMIPRDSVLMVIRGMILDHSFPVAVSQRDLTINQDMKALVLAMPASRDFILLVFQAFKRRVLNLVQRSSHGTCRLPIDDVAKLAFPLPPLAEQKRIVSKVDRLMGICDRLESERRETLSLTDRSRRSVLASLTSSRDASELASSWRRLSDHFEILHDRPETLADLRQTILALAVQGKLVKQRSDDEPASDLLERVLSLKDDLKSKGEIKPPKCPRPIVEDPPFVIPESWVWTKLGAIAHGIESGWSPRCESHPRDNDEWGVLKISAVTWDEYRSHENKALPAGIEPREHCEVRDGDFLISRANTAELVAKSVVVKRTPPKLMLNDKLLRIAFAPGLSLDYLNLVNNSSSSRVYYESVASGTSVSMRNVSRENVTNLPMPLPPLPEQDRIVAKVDRLLAQCDRVAEQLRDRQATTEQLLTATIHQILKTSEDRSQ